jgi:paraquat-inducible protein A
MNQSDAGHVSCPLCGRLHHPVALKRGERALCARCGTTLDRRRGGHDAALAFTLTALILAVPAVELPLVVVRKFGAEHASYVWTGIRSLWQDGMPLLSVWVALCGVVVPLTLLTTLVMLILARSRGPYRRAARVWARTAHALQHWSMPEVQVLAVLVAFVKIGALVQVHPGLGLWFYAAMTVAMLLAWRSTELLEVCA